MKAWTAFALVLVLGVVPANAEAQEQDKKPEDNQASVSSRIELLELEQDVDKTLLHDAMLQLGRSSLRQMPDRPGFDDRMRERQQANVAALKEVIEEKKHAYTRRSDELKKLRAELKKQQITPATPTRNQVGQVRNPVDEKERQGLVEKLMDSQVEAQLLQSQEQSYQQRLNEAIQALTQADFAASNDPTQQEKADAARKRFEKAKAKFVDISKRLQLEQGKIGEMQSRTGRIGMGGMGGMGGGFR